MVFNNKLINWYSNNKRFLPWRLKPEPYKIWLSEIILQQTKVKQGLPFYRKFINRYPSLKLLAGAHEDQILKLWQGLGYYSRARNLLTTAKFIYEELHGNFPDNYHDLLKLKGVGPYTAAAIASICFNEPVAVVDGNVYRVLSRYFNIHTPINSSKGIKEFKIIAHKMLDTKNPGEYNQAIMDFGALICKPINAKCNICPLKKSCSSLRKKTTDKLPVKIKSRSLKKRYFNYLVTVTDTDKVILKKRINKDIWLNLYEFPLIEKKESINMETLKKSDLFINLFKLNDKPTVRCFNKVDIVSKLSHQYIYSKFWIINVKSHPLATIKLSEISNFAVPIHISNFIEAFKKLN